jgi:hypothetical protein
MNLAAGGDDRQIPRPGTRFKIMAVRHCCNATYLTYHEASSAEVSLIAHLA